jgi:hypothetical protein
MSGSQDRQIIAPPIDIPPFSGFPQASHILIFLPPFWLADSRQDFFWRDGNDLPISDLYELAALVWLPDFIDFAFLQLEGSGASSPAATPIATNRLQKVPLVGVLWIASDNFGDPLLAATGLMSYPEDGVGLGCHGCHVSFPFRCFFTISITMIIVIVNTFLKIFFNF